MKNYLKHVLYLLFAVILVSSQAQALTARQIVEPFFGGETRVTMGCDDVSSLLNGSDDPLAQVMSRLVFPLIRDRTTAGALASIKAVAVRASERHGAENGEQAVFAIEIDPSFSVPVPADAGFSLPPAPEGVELDPLSMTKDGYAALLRRGGQTFIIGASDDPLMLNAMAVVPEETPVEPRHVDEPLWIALTVARSELEEFWRGTAMSDVFGADLRLEYGIGSTPDSFRVRAWTNSAELVQESPDPGRECLYAPRPVGGDSLYGLLSFEGLASSMSRHKNFGFLKGWLHKAAQMLDLTDEEFYALLDSRVTAACAGSFSFLLGSLPGAYVHLEGIPRHVSEKLLSLCFALINGQKSLSGKSEFFSEGEWSGLRMMVGGMVPAYGAVSDRGLIFGLQDSGELSKKPSVAPEISETLQSKPPFVLCLDTQTILARLRTLIASMGALVLGVEERQQVETVMQMLEGFGVFTLAADSVSECRAELFICQPAFGQLLDAAAGYLSETQGAKPHIGSLLP